MTAPLICGFVYLDGIVLSPVTSLSGYQPGGITAVGEALTPLLGA